MEGEEIDKRPSRHSSGHSVAAALEEHTCKSESDQEELPTENSFSRSASWQQVTSILMQLFLLATYVLLVAPKNDLAGAILTGFYAVLFVTVAGLWLAVSFIDPADKSVLRRIGDSRRVRSPDGRPEVVCPVCNCGVGPDTRHCKVCDRCIKGFDHHCKWINNCIGHRNYRFFVLLLAAVIAQLTVFAAAVILQALRLAKVGQAISSPQSLSFWEGSPWVQLGLLIPGLSFALLAACLLSFLLLFHCYLICKGITTYQFFRGEPPTKKVAAIKV